jgi:hypothetical protein
MVFNETKINTIIGNDTPKIQKRLKINLFTPAPRGVN